MNSQVFKLFADCIPVKGFKRSAIYDLGRCKYRLIPNILYEILKEFEGKSIEDVKNHYKGNDLIIDEYFDFLLEDEYIFWCNAEEVSNFPPLNLFWDYPGEISNAIIRVHPETDSNINTIIAELSTLGCKDVILHIEISPKEAFINEILHAFEHSPYRSVDFFLPYSNELHDGYMWRRICDVNLIIHRVIIYNAPFEQQLISENKVMGNIIFSKQKDINYNKISKYSFVINIPTFTEAQQHNLFFNRKLIISSSGVVTNSLFDNSKKWNVKENSLQHIISEEDFREKWFINKDKIAICQDCEYRYMCIDSRDPKKAENNHWFFDSECGYNPYIAKWEDEEGYSKPKICIPDN
jgi:SPASM domain peptide maturase of grasp-with-spasm system